MPERTATIEMPRIEKASSSRRADVEHERPQDRQREPQQHRAEQAAQQRGHVGGAERPPGLAALGHGQAVEHGRRRAGAARHAEQDRRDRVAGRRGGAKPEQEGEGRVGVHAEGEGEQQRCAGDAADAGQDAEDQAEHHAGGEEQQAERVHQDEESVTRCVEHAAVHAVTPPTGRASGADWEKPPAAPARSR